MQKMSGVLTNTTLTLNSGAANELVLSAPTNNDLFLSSATPGNTVTLTGVRGLLCSTAFNQGSPLTGLCMSFVCSGSNSNVGTRGAFGNGQQSIPTGLMMPNNGSIVAWSVALSPFIPFFDSIALTLVKNSTLTSTVMSLTNTQFNSFTINVPFVAGDQFNVQSTTAGSSSYAWMVTFWVRYTE